MYELVLEALELVLLAFAGLTLTGGEYIDKLYANSILPVAMRYCRCTVLFAACTQVYPSISRDRVLSKFGSRTLLGSCPDAALVLLAVPAVLSSGARCT